MNELQNITNKASLFITFDDAVSTDWRNYILAKLDGETVAENKVDTSSSIGLIVGENSLALSSREIGPKALVSINFHQGAANHRRLYGGGKSQSLVKAVGLDTKKDIQVIDATAGLAGDSFVLASLGARVTMLERSPVLALLIEHAMSTAKQYAIDDTELNTIVERMQLFNEDAQVWLTRQEENSCAVIYLDPMFPERRKKAAVKKEMQVLQHLLGEGLKTDQERLVEEQALLELALQKALYRVVVKRPRHAPHLPGIKPGYTLEGKSTRFDIYPMKKIS